MNRKHACALILCALLGSATLNIFAAETTVTPAETTAPETTTAAPQTTTPAPETTTAPITTAPETTAAPTYSYQLTLLLDDGTVCQSYSQTTTAASCTFPLISPPAKHGYTFLGWTDGFNLYNNAYLAAPGSHTLRAVWEATAYTVTYVDGSTVLGLDTYTVEKAPSLLPRTKDGYTFLGWALNGQILPVFPSGVTGNITLTAQWQLNKYTVSFDTTGGDPLPASPYTIESGLVLPSPTRTGYTFTGWTTLTGTPVGVIPVGTYGNIALRAQWEAINYTITYNSAGGTALPPTMYTIETGARLPTPTRPGYTFSGWRDERGLPVDAVPVGSYGNIALTAEWIEQTVTIHYTAATVGGTVSVPTETIGMATGMPMSTAIPNAGYRFAGWYRDPACTIPVEAGWVDATAAIHPQRSGAAPHRRGLLCPLRAAAGQSHRKRKGGGGRSELDLHHHRQADRSRAGADHAHRGHPRWADDGDGRRPADRRLHGHRTGRLELAICADGRNDAARRSERPDRCCADRAIRPPAHHRPLAERLCIS